MTTVLVVDDVAPMAEQYAYDLQRMGRYHTMVAPGGAAALDLLGRESIDCVILDLEMPGTDGFAVLRELAARPLAPPVIVYTGTGNYDRCVQAIRAGAYSFIDKTEPMERVVREIENAVAHGRLSDEVERLREQLEADSALIGDSEAMHSLRDMIARVGPVPSPILIVGESGSGKELVARDLHRASRASAGPFVALNCAALPEHLVESELFGHERGAFTGAVRLRKGAFESAVHGTLFLDEIGELPIGSQAKLLRVLEQREVTRLGGTRTISVDTRVVAATNRVLEDEIAAGRFREDLFYRLGVHVVRVPALRDRTSDVPALVEHFLVGTSRRFGMRPKRIASTAIEALMAYDWQKNNVRELRNVVERMIIAATGDEIQPADIPPEIRGGAGTNAAPALPIRGSFQEQKLEAERRILVAALERHDWHITNTARDLGLADHASLLKIMRRHRLKRD